MEKETTKKCPHCQTDISKDAKKCPQCHADLRSWFRRHPILTGLGVLVIFGIVGSISGDSKSSEETAQVPAEQEVATDVKAAANETSNKPEVKTPSSAKTYQQVFTFSGNGTKKSEPFTITGSRFKIKYDCTGDYCQAWLYKVGSSVMSDLIMNNQGSIKDETIIYGSGQYYIDANTIGSFTMIVEDYK